MLFEKLVVSNLGVFRGEHSIRLSAVEKNKPVILIGALNGSGKTTVIEALQLALYGKRAAFGWRLAKNYSQYLDQVRNSHAPNQETTLVEVSLRLTDHRHIRVRREWDFSRSQPKEYLSVFIGDSDIPDASMSEGWDDEIERLLPARLSELFFFDGERLEKLADPTQNADVIKSAVSSLLGLDLVDHLCTDMEILKTRQKQRMLSESQQNEYESVLIEIDKVSRQIEDLVQKRASEMSKLDRAYVEKSRADIKYQEQGGQRFENRQRLATELSEYKGRISAVEGQLRAVASGVLPLYLAFDVLSELTEDSKNPKIAGDDKAINEFNYYLDSLEKWIVGRKFSDEVKKEIVEHIVNTRLSIGNSASSLDGINWSALKHRLRFVVDSSLSQAGSSTENLIKSLNDYNEKAALIEEQLAKVPEHEQLAEIIRAQSVAESNILICQNELKDTDEQLHRMRRGKESLEQRRLSILERNVDASDAARISDYCDRSIKSLKNFRARLVAKRREQLEKLILEAFILLVRKPDLVGRVSLDSETMVISLFTPEGMPKLINQLSAGERQLLAVSMLWGLARASGRPVPIVIDSPMGRLDGEHRRSLVGQYFPHASHQVILLSTDKEVDDEFNEIIDPSVADRYLIGYNSEQRTSLFTAGYFGR